MPAKLVTDREQAAFAAEAAFAAHLEPVTAGLARWLEPELRPGETLPDLAFYLQLLRRALARRREELVEADDVHQVGKNLAALPRRQRDEAAAAVRDKLLALRLQLTSHYDHERASAMLRMKGRLPEEPFPLLRQGRSTLAALRRFAKTPPPPSELPPALAWNPAAFASDLQATLRPLEAAFTRVLEDRKDGQLRHSAKMRALREFDATFRRSTRLLEAHLDAADMLWAAKKVRTKRRHRRKKPRAAAKE